MLRYFVKNNKENELDKYEDKKITPPIVFANAIRVESLKLFIV